MVIAICDDDYFFTEKIKNNILTEFQKAEYDHDSEDRILQYMSGKSIIEACSKEEIDAVIMDIELGECLGFDVVKELVELKKDIMIVYMSNYDHYVFKSFACRPLGFVRKKCVEQDLPRALFIMCNEWNKRNRTFTFTVKGEEYKVILSKVCAVEMQGHTMYIEMVNDTITLNYSMAKIEKELHESGFIKVRRGVMVNPLMINNIDNSMVYMLNHKNYPISRENIKEVRRKWTLSKLM